MIIKERFKVLDNVVANGFLCCLVIFEQTAIGQQLARPEILPVLKGYIIAIPKFKRSTNVEGERLYSLMSQDMGSGMQYITLV